MKQKQIVKIFDEEFAERKKKLNTQKKERNTVHPNQNVWLDIHLKKEIVDYLWDIINQPSEKSTDAKTALAGNISKSFWIDDLKDDWFYENILDDCVKTLYFRKWINYYNVCLAKTMELPVFKLKELWVNYQKQYEFNPVHNHAGDFSFVIFMKIPTHWKEQHALPWLKNVGHACASNFQFLLGGAEGTGGIHVVDFPLSPEDEGRMMFFPAWLNHQVFPFYGTEEERITVSGNIFLEKSSPDSIHTNSMKHG